jgi:hypothetical protein
MKKNLFPGLISGLILFNSCGPGEVIVSTRPEPPYYVRSISPGMDYVWIDGDWIPRAWSLSLERRPLEKTRGPCMDNSKLAVKK